MPASATVHEIVGQRCAGKPGIHPPGITGESKADNFAQPLFANGYATLVFGFDPAPTDPEVLPSILIDFDFDHPAGEIIPTGGYVIDEILPDGAPIYLPAHAVDIDHPHANCKFLSGD